MNSPLDFSKLELKSKEQELEIVELFTRLHKGGRKLKPINDGTYLEFSHNHLLSKTTYKDNKEFGLENLYSCLGKIIIRQVYYL